MIEWHQVVFFKCHWFFFGIDPCRVVPVDAIASAMCGSISEPDTWVGLLNTVCSNVLNRIVLICRQPAVISTRQSLEQVL